MEAVGAWLHEIAEFGDELAEAGFVGFEFEDAELDAGAVVFEFVGDFGAALVGLDIVSNDIVHGCLEVFGIVYQENGLRQWFLVCGVAVNVWVSGV